MQALQRLTQKNINMEIEIKPRSLSYKASEVNGGNPCKIYIKIVRGPLTWQSKDYQLDQEEISLQFDNDSFKKKSGLYFTKGGAEYKKATILVMKKDSNGAETEMTSNDINISSLISAEMKDNRIEIDRNGFMALTIQSKIYPI